MTLSQRDRVNQYLINTEGAVRKHVELDELAQYDKNKLTKVIDKYNKWYSRYYKHNLESHRIASRAADAIFNIEKILHENTEVELSTLEDTVWGDGAYTHFPVQELFEQIDILRPYLTNAGSESEYEPELLMDIVNELEKYTRCVIQNTSMQRLHKKSWEHVDLLEK